MFGVAAKVTVYKGWIRRKLNSLVLCLVLFMFIEITCYDLYVHVHKWCKFATCGDFPKGLDVHVHVTVHAITIPLGSKLCEEVCEVISSTCE